MAGNGTTTVVHGEVSQRETTPTPADFQEVTAQICHRKTGWYGYFPSLNVSRGPGPQAGAFRANEGNKRPFSAQNLLKTAVYADEQTGPYSGHMAGMVSGLDKIIAAHKKNRQESPWHYWGKTLLERTGQSVTDLTNVAERAILECGQQERGNASVPTAAIADHHTHHLLPRFDLSPARRAFAGQVVGVQSLGHHTFMAVRHDVVEEGLPRLLHALREQKAADGSG